MERLDYEALVTVAPDGGYGWIIVLVAFIGLLVIDGICFSLYLYKETLAMDLNVATTQTSAVIGTFIAVSFFVGPLVSGLSNRFGFRMVSMIGSFMLSFSLFLSYFGGSITYYYVFFSFLGGTGFGFLVIPLLLAVSFWFDKRRAIANGLAASGSGLGNLLMPILSQTVITRYGWRSCFIFQGALVGLLIAIMTGLRPLKPVSLEMPRRRSQTQRTPAAGAPPGQTRYGNVVQSVGTPTALEVVGSTRQRVRADSSLFDDDLSERPSIYTPFSGALPRPFVSTAHAAVRPARESPGSRWCPACCRWCRKRRNNLGSRPMYRRDIFYQGSVYRLDKQVNLESRMNYHMSVTHLPTRKDIIEEKEGTCTLCPEAVMRPIATMVDFSLFKRVEFILIVTSYSLFYCACFIPGLQLFVQAKVYNMDMEMSEFLVPTIGLGNFFGRLLSGFFLQMFPFMSAHGLVTGILGFAALATIINGCVQVLPYKFAYAFSFGFSFGLIIPLRSVVIVDFIGLDKLTAASGILFMFLGIGVISGTPLAEFLFNATGDVNAPFFLAGIVFLLAAISHFLIKIDWSR